MICFCSFMARRRPSLKLGARLQVLSEATQSPVPPLLIGQRVLHLGLHTLHAEDLHVGRCLPGVSMLGTTNCLLMGTRGCSVL